MKITNEEFDEWLVDKVSAWASDEAWHIDQNHAPHTFMTSLASWLVQVASYSWGENLQSRYSQSAWGAYTRTLWHDSDAYVHTVEWLRNVLVEEDP